MFVFFLSDGTVGIKKRHTYPACDEEEEVDHVGPSFVPKPCYLKLACSIMNSWLFHDTCSLIVYCYTA